MPTYQIEMLWTCVQCGHKGNKGLAKHCVNCGFPKNEKCEEYFPDDISEVNAIQDAGQLKLAQAGPDWKCKFCGTLQTAFVAFCANCGCNRETGERPWQAKVKSITQDTVTGEKHEHEPVVTEENGRTVVTGGTITPDFLQDLAAGKIPPNPPPRISDKDVDEILGPQPYRSSPRRTRPQPPPPTSWDTDVSDEIPKVRFPWAKVGIGAAVVVALTVILWLVFRTKIVDATVSDVSWEYKVLIDRYQVWHRDGWNPDPGSFDVRNEGQRIHHYDKVVSGSHQEPYSESYTCGETCTTTPRTCTSNKNGSATCSGGDRSCSPKTCTRTAYRTVTDYRDEPRYQTYYSWSVWDWGYNRTVSESAHDFEPRWPKPERLTVPLASGEQERQRREEHYKVVFSASDAKQYDMAPKTLAEFTRFPRGRHVRLKVGIAHGVEVLPERAQ